MVIFDKEILKSFVIGTVIWTTFCAIIAVIYFY